MSEPFIGQIIQGGWNFAPRGYVTCGGQLLSVSQNSALFSLLGVAFGGNGTSTFGVPNLLGRTMIGAGNGAGLSPYALGQTGGTENVTLGQANLPPHSHALNVTSTKGSAQTAAANMVIGRGTDGATPPAAIPQIYAPAGTNPDVTLSPASIGQTGNGAPVSVLQPFQAVTIVIATEGIFPSRP